MGYTLPRSRKTWFDAIIADHVARIASGLEDVETFDSRVLAKHVIEAVKRTGMGLRKTKDGLLVCPYCGRAPFTKKGYYLHLLRSHYQEMIDSVGHEIERLASASKDVEL